MTAVAPSEDLTSPEDLTPPEGYPLSSWAEQDSEFWVPPQLREHYAARVISKYENRIYWANEGQDVGLDGLADFTHRTRLEHAERHFVAQRSQEQRDATRRWQTTCEACGQPDPDGKHVRQPVMGDLDNRRPVGTLPDERLRRLCSPCRDLVAGYVVEQRGREVLPDGRTRMEMLTALLEDGSR